MKKFIFLTTMKHIMILLLLIAIIGITGFCIPGGIQPVAAQSPDFCDNVTIIPTSECEALVALYNSTDGDNWSNKDGWLDTSTPCSWYGVGCGAGHVTNLNLHGNQLSGNIPAELGNLANLTSLLLSLNNLSGNIPPELGNLANLSTLYLYTNQLSGNIPPELGNLVNLRSLDLHGNQLSGPLPASLTNLTALLYFRFNGTNLCEPTDTAFQNWLDSIFYLYSTDVACGFCDNVTEIPKPECEALVALYSSTDGNNSWWPNTSGWLETSTPCSWYGVTCSAGQVTRIDLSSNGLAWSIPPALGNLAELTSLDLGGNHLRGNIPPQLGNLAELTSLDLDYNQLSGNIPPELGNLANLDRLDLRSNQLSGSIPPELGNLTKLTTLFLIYNQLNGNIPPELGNLGQLRDLYLHSNQLSGSIPPELGNLANLKGLFLSSNQLSGALPASLTNLTALGSFYFNDTSLCEPQDTAFQNWLDAIPSVDSTDVACTVAFYYEAVVDPDDPIWWQGQNLRDDPQVGNNPYWISGTFGWDSVSADGDFWLSRVTGFPIFEPEDLLYLDVTILDNVEDDNWLRDVDMVEIGAYFGPSELDLLGWVDFELKYSDDVWSSSSLPMDLSMDGLLVGQITIETFDNLNYIYAEITNLQNYIIPEPTTIVLLGSGILILAGLRKIRRTAK